MSHIKLIFYIILIGLLILNCGSKNADIKVTPDEFAENIKEETYSPEKNNEQSTTKILTENRNIDDIINELHMEIKSLRAELDYQDENIGKIEAQNQLWSNPFSIYNKEIVLNNGSSIFGKIVYQDHDVMKVETLIGQLIIDRNNIVRVVNQIGAYNKFSDDNSYNAMLDEDNNSEISEINLIQKRIPSQSAELVLVGDISEEKDTSGNTVLTGEVKNVGDKRADFAKIIFSFRINWQGDTKNLTTFINGVTNTFNTGISSDNSILPHEVGNFELIIPKSFGPFIGYNYDIDWSQYDQ